MRPDTPQHYEYIIIENAKGKVNEFININPWQQFFDLKGRKDIPLSYANNISIRNCELECGKYLNVKLENTQYKLSDFTLENLIIKTDDVNYPKDFIDNSTVNNVTIK